MQKQENNVYYAGFFVRLGALLLDELFIGLLLLFVKMSLLLITMGGMTGSPLFSEVLFQFTAWDIIFYLLTKGYFIATTYSAGATLGKKLMKLKVVAADGKSLTVWNVLYRETIGKYLSGLFLCIGYIIIGIDREKRGFHDMLCDTLVIYNLNNLQIVDVNERDTGICQFRSSNNEPDNQSDQSANRYKTNDVDEYYRKPEIKKPYAQGGEKERAPYEAASYGYDGNKKEAAGQETYAQLEEKEIEKQINSESEKQEEAKEIDSVDHPND